MGLMDILNQYANPNSAPMGNVEQHFDEVATKVDPNDLGRGISAALRSDATPPFGQSMGSLFGQSNPQQQAGLLNQLVQALGSGALSGVAGQILGKIVGNTPAGGTPPTITPTQASQLSPDDVTTLATHAQSADDSVVDKLGKFYAEHPTLVKSLGAAALAIALGKMRRE
jgi:hypothetical protein